MKTRVGGGEALEGDDSQLVVRRDSKRKKKKKKKNSTPTTSTSTTATTTTNATTTTTASSDELSSSSSDEKRTKKKKNKKAAQQVLARSNVMHLKSDNHLQSVARQGGKARELKTLLQRGPLLVLTVLLILATGAWAWFFLLQHVPDRGNASGAQVVEPESPVAAGAMQAKQLPPQQAFVQKRRKKTNLRGGFAPPTVQDEVPPASSDGVVASTTPYQKDCDEATNTPSGVNCTPKKEKGNEVVVSFLERVKMSVQSAFSSLFQLRTTEQEGFPASTAGGQTEVAAAHGHDAASLSTTSNREDFSVGELGARKAEAGSTSSAAAGNNILQLFVLICSACKKAAVIAFFPFSFYYFRIT